MTGPAQKLAERLAGGEVVVIDGGVGTHVEALGGRTVAGVWSGAMVLEHPDLVEQAHLDYLHAGAEVLIANTYASGRHLLERAGYGDRFVEVNHSAVELARRARERSGRPDVVVAGSISTTEMQGERGPLSELAPVWREQAKVLADAGSELIALEMMRNVPTTEAALEAALATGLPVWLGWSCVPGPDGQPLLLHGEDTLADAMTRFAGAPLAAVTVMHTEIDHIDACLDVVQDHWDGPVGVYAHVGDFIDFVWHPDPSFTPEQHTEHNLRWLERGVQIVGGCCGIGPDHISHLRRTVD